MKRVLTLCLMLCAALAFSQEKKPVKDRNLPLGNKQFEEKAYADAEASYRIAHSNAPTKAAASYNLGNAIYKQKKPGEALFAYAKAIEVAKDKSQKHMAYHNMGNALMEEKNYQGAVEAYKNALRNDPADNQSRYNYALAKEMLKNNPPPPQPKDKDKNKDKGNKDDKKPQDKGDNKDKGGKGDQKDEGDPKDKGDNKDKGGKGDQKDKNEDKGDQKDKQNGDGRDKQNNADPQPSNASPSKQRMQNMLDAMNNEEKKVQDKLNAKRVKAQSVKTEKDW